MTAKPPSPDDRHPDADDARHPRQTRIHRVKPPRASQAPRWVLEMLESPLIDRGLTYTVTDGESNRSDGDGWIEFDLPTTRYMNASRQHRLRVRLAVTDGQFTITAPNVYPRKSLRRTSDPPPDAAGNLRLVRIGDEGDTNLDLVMAADGTTTAVLVMDTIQQPFNRADVVQIAEEFALGVDLLDLVVRESHLLLPRPRGLP